MQLPEAYPDFLREVYPYQEEVIHPTTHCVRLKKALYGLVQAARQWWRKFKAVMKNIGYRPSEIDPCLLVNEKSDGTKAFVIIYVDDGAVFGTRPEDYKKDFKRIKQLFQSERSGTIKTFCGMPHYGIVTNS